MATTGLNNRQTKTNSFDRTQATRIGPEEPLKNVWQIVGRDSRAGIEDFQRSLPVNQKPSPDGQRRHHHQRNQKPARDMLYRQS